MAAMLGEIAGKEKPYDVCRTYTFVWFLLYVFYLVDHLKLALGFKALPVTPDVLDFYYEDWDYDTSETDRVFPGVSDRTRVRAALQELHTEAAKRKYLPP